MSRRSSLRPAPPIAPMLAALARELPIGPYLYEPKWDGFRCLAFRDGDDVDLRSRNQRPLARYFPEVTAALRALPDERVALDGELVVSRGGRLDFEALLARLHPASSRVERLSRETPATYVAFDLLGLDDEDVVTHPFRERRRRLERLLSSPPPRLALTRATDDPSQAELWLERFHGAGIDGVVAKRLDGPYEPGRRAMVKVKRERTADCVVGGFRWLVDRPLPSSLLLGLYDEEGTLRHVGIVSAFSERFRAALLDVLRPLVVPLEGHPWEHGFLLAGGATGRLRGSAGSWRPDEMPQDWTPVRPQLVCEVAFDQLDGPRFRHPGRFRRWRPDRDPSSCMLDQLELASAALGDLLP